SAAASPASASATATAAPNPAAPQGPSGGLTTGVQIHGHWKIVVRNPDGTVATRRDFENSITFNGAYLLQNILGGNMTPGAWAIGMGAQLSGNTGPCAGISLNIANNIVPTPVSSGNCYIAEPSGVYGDAALQGSQCNPANSCSPNLVRQQLPFQVTTQTLTGPGGVSLISQSVSSSGFELNGTATATAGGTIDTVTTLLMVCNWIQVGFQGSGTITNQPLTTVSSIDPNTCSYPPVGGLAFKGYPVGISRDFGTVFTSAILNGASATSTPPAPVQVIANQTIQVTVVFTFN
ncbi:MAG: hypothetical protein WB621_03110, partial [Candidatus Acidiferrales bacterium]